MVAEAEGGMRTRRSKTIRKLELSPRRGERKTSSRGGGEEEAETGLEEDETMRMSEEKQGRPEEGEEEEGVRAWAQ